MSDIWLTPDTYRTGTGNQNLSVGTDPLTANTYTYVNGDPVNLSDPSGHGCIDYGPCGQRPVRKLNRDAYQIISAFHAQETPKQYQKKGRAFSNHEADMIVAAWEMACRRGKCPSNNEMLEWAFRGRSDMESRKTHLPGWREIVELVGSIPGIDTLTDPVLCGHSLLSGKLGAAALDCGLTFVPLAGAGLARTGGRLVDNLVGAAPTQSLDDLAGAACSFDGKTKVLMADGSTAPISEIEVGDYVLAENAETGERGLRRVTHVWKHEDTVVDLEIDGGLVTTTEDHPFWNESDREWQRADALDPGDLLLSADGDLVHVDGLDSASTRTTTAYNLTVDDIHTYFVVVDGEGILVHNTCDVPIPWSHPSLGQASKALDQGATSVQVGSRAEAEELFLGKYQGAGYNNTTGMSAMEAKDFYGAKSGTYHWDGPDPNHGNLPHLQVHTHDGRVIRVFYP